MRLLHFSDIHCGLHPNGIRWLFNKRLLGTCTHFARRKSHQDFSVIERLISLARTLHPDIIICTGDITAVANPDEFALAIERLSPLLELPNTDVIYIPGNHDAYIRDAAVTAARNKAVECLNTLPALKKPLPFQHITRDNVSLEILDTACPMPYWRSAGTADKQALSELVTAARQPRKSRETRVLLSHFPVYTPTGKRLSWRRRLDGDLAIRALAEERQLDLCLCGHIHTPFIYNAANGFTQVCAGSLTLRQMATIIDLAPDTTAVTAKLIDLSL